MRTTAYLKAIIEIYGKTITSLGLRMSWFGVHGSKKWCSLVLYALKRDTHNRSGYELIKVV